MKKQKHYYISQDIIDYIEEYKSKNNNATISSALESIILEHKTNSSMTSDYVYDVIAKKLSEHIKSELKSMIHSSRSADKNSQILIELINAYIFNTTSSDFKDITTSKYKTKVLETATLEVENKILKNIRGKSEMIL